MGRHTVFRLWEGVLPGQLCELILALGRGEEPSKAELRPDQGGDYLDESIRKTNIFFWDSSHWVSALTTHYAQWANDETWNYRLSLSQGVQFGRYGIGGTYDWHKDEFDQPFGEEAPQHWRGLSRKLSVAVNLSDPADYQGGDLLFKDTYGMEVVDEDLRVAIRQQGSVVVFPAYTPHTVTAVTEGIRCSLVSWVLGPPFS